MSSWPETLWYCESDYQGVIMLNLKHDRLFTAIYENKTMQSTLTINAIEVNEHFFKTKEEVFAYRSKQIDLEISRLEKLKIKTPEVLE